MVRVYRTVVLAAVVFASAHVAEAGTVSGKARVAGKDSAANIVVYLEGVNGTFKLPEKRPEMNHINLQFQPSVMAVLKGTTVDFPNSDSVFHSAFSISPSNPFDLGLYQKGREKFVVFKNPGVVELFCHIHSHMHGFILVLDNPYFATTNPDGGFSIANVPDGDYTVKAWASPTATMTKTVSLNGDKTVNMDFTLTADSDSAFAATASR
ncbi:MAG TPA: carboxypeptidase regulatory-like domain-containing protein [Nitrospiria bacterium]|nr:carboxypeptidase regulatory-like domain-containing protein [Nitrospiria bacterium]